MKVILSRKGFDSASGGYPSPLIIEENRLVSLPIPEDNDANDIDTGVTYSNLMFNSSISYSDIIYDLNKKYFNNRFVHLDPDNGVPFIYCNIHHL